MVLKPSLFGNASRALKLWAASTHRTAVNQYHLFSGLLAEWDTQSCHHVQRLIPGEDGEESGSQFTVPVPLKPAGPCAALQVLRGGGGCYTATPDGTSRGPPRPTFETPGDSESHFLAIEMTASLFLHTGGRLLLSVVGNLP